MVFKHLAVERFTLAEGAFRALVLAEGGLQRGVGLEQGGGLLAQGGEGIVNDPIGEPGECRHRQQQREHGQGTQQDDLRLEGAVGADDRDRTSIVVPEGEADEQAGNEQHQAWGEEDTGRGDHHGKEGGIDERFRAEGRDIGGLQDDQCDEHQQAQRRKRHVPAAIQPIEPAQQPQQYATNE